MLTNNTNDLVAIEASQKIARESNTNLVASLGRNAQADLRQILQPYQNTRVEEDHLGDQESGNDSPEVEKVIIMDQGHKPEIPFLSEEEASAGNHASSAEAPALKKPLYSRTIDRDESKLTEERPCQKCVKFGNLECRSLPGSTCNKCRERKVRCTDSAGRRPSTKFGPKRRKQAVRTSFKDQTSAASAPIVTSAPTQAPSLRADFPPPPPETKRPTAPTQSAGGSEELTGATVLSQRLEAATVRWRKAVASAETLLDIYENTLARLTEVEGYIYDIKSLPFS